MSEQGDHKEIAGFFTLRAGVRARAARVTKRLLRAADRLDYLIRHWLVPISFEQGARSRPEKNAWVPSHGLPNNIQDAIGRRLRAQYAVERSMPARLANLLQELERRANQAEATARDGYARAA